MALFRPPRAFRTFFGLVVGVVNFSISGVDRQSLKIWKLDSSVSFIVLADKILA